MLQPVTIPSNATAYLNLEQQPGWTKQSGPAITGKGAVTPETWDIVQVTPPPIVQATTLKLRTTGVKGQYCDWMAKAAPLKMPAGAASCLIRSSYTLDTILGLQALEIGWRGTNEQGITNNGQAELVPINGGKQLRLDLVPSAQGGWEDATVRFPMFVAGRANQQEQFYAMDPDGALSMQYFMLNGALALIPVALQKIAGAKQNPPWALLTAVPAVQIDANPTGTPFEVQVALSIWFW